MGSPAIVTGFLAANCDQLTVDSSIYRSAVSSSATAVGLTQPARSTVGGEGVAFGCRTKVGLSASASEDRYTGKPDLQTEHARQIAGHGLKEGRGVVIIDSLSDRDLCVD